MCTEAAVCPLYPSRVFRARKEHAFINAFSRISRNSSPRFLWRQSLHLHRNMLPTISRCLFAVGLTRFCIDRTEINTRSPSWKSSHAPVCSHRFPTCCNRSIGHRPSFTPTSTTLQIPASTASSFRYGMFPSKPSTTWKNFESLIVTRRVISSMIHAKRIYPMLVTFKPIRSLETRPSYP